MDIVQLYLAKRLAELRKMLDVYDEAGVEPPVDLLARKQELERLNEALADYMAAEEE